MSKSTIGIAIFIRKTMNADYSVGRTQRINTLFTGLQIMLNHYLQILRIQYHEVIHIPYANSVHGKLISASDYVNLLWGLGKNILHVRISWNRFTIMKGSLHAEQMAGL